MSTSLSIFIRCCLGSLFAHAGVAVTTLNDVPSSTNHFGAVIMDILDYGNTNKNKTVRALSGAASAANQIMLSSDLWANTAAITSLTVTCSGGGYYTTGSRFSLYGIRGA